VVPDATNPALPERIDSVGDHRSSSPGRSAPWESPIALTGLLVLAGVAYVLRRPDVLTSPSFWAEDGTRFFKDAVEKGTVSLFLGTNGQWFLFQRAIALLVRPLPVGLQPALYSVTAIVITVLAVGLLLSRRWRAPVSVRLRYACLIAILCTPSVDEAFGNLVNVHWWLSIGLVLLGMLWDPISARARRGEMVFVGVTALSGFSGLYGLPSLLVRAGRARSRHSAGLVVVAVVGIAVQIVYLFTSGRHGDPGIALADLGTAATIFVKRIFGTAAVGDDVLIAAWPSREPAVWVLGLTLLLLVSTLVIWLTEARLETAALVATMLGGWLLILYAGTQAGASFDNLLRPAAGGRLLLVPIAILPVSIVARRRASNAVVATVAAVSILSFGAVSDYRLQPRQPMAWRDFAQCIEARQGPCRTTIPPNWSLDVDPTVR
jgi:hypothetical protein